MTDPQRDALDHAAAQILDAVAEETRMDQARLTARQRLEFRAEWFMVGLIQIGFTPRIDRDPGGRLVITIDPDAWDEPIPGPMDKIGAAE